ncbi:MAG: DNA polymerase III [Bdellovibrionales bacterium GWB1_55_8]|nr:MAG: DNA polymerase III [Bdellovibrionales bacterium GWB1_55_8]
MALSNSSIAAVFDKVADLLDIEGANQFRVRAYRTAARTIAIQPESVAESILHGRDLSELPGIGKDLAGKIEEVATTGRLNVLEDVEKRVPEGLSALLEIPGMGPKRVRVLKERCAVSSMESLERVLKTGQIRELPGFGPKTEAAIRDGIERRKLPGQSRVTRALGDEVTRALLPYLKSVDGVLQVVAAGSYRRGLETIGDIDILATCTDAVAMMDAFVKYPEVLRVLSRGITRSTIVLTSGIQVDLRVVPAESYGAALVYFTGSKAHNIAIRAIGVKKGLKVNEYGVFKGRRRLCGKTEEEVYARLGLAWIEPELRENRGEVEAARDGKLPELLRLDQIRGDLHAHTVATDGRRTLEEMAEAARAKGYEYLSISDHTKRLTVARGQDEKRLREQIRAIDRLNARFSGFQILKSAEVDILEDGSLDLPDSILKELDIRVCSIHYKFNLPIQQQTERVIRAMDNPYFNILAHPTGRLIGRREGYALDLDRVIAAAAERGVFLELNSQPDRLDLTDIYCRKARDMGAKIVISTDAHSDLELDFMRFGVGQARRGWLRTEDVVNTRSWSRVRTLFRRAPSSGSLQRKKPQ